MDESSLRDLLRHATEAEPPMGPVAHNSLLAGIKLRRRRRAINTVSFAAVVAVLAAGIPAVAHSLRHVPGPAGAAAQPQWLGRVAYVVSSGPNWTGNRPTHGVLTPISLATNKPGMPIKLGVEPAAITITPNGRTAYVVNGGSNSVTPITTADNMPGRAIKVGHDPAGLAITPDGKTLYVANTTDGTVTPITTATDRPGKPIRVGRDPVNILITPNGKTAYVETEYSVVPITTATNAAGKPIYTVPASKNAGFGSLTASNNGGTEYFGSAYSPWDIAITPNGQNLYIAIANSGEVIPVVTATNRVGKAIKVGNQPVAFAVAPSGKTVYVASNNGTVTPIETATNRPGKVIKLHGKQPSALVIAPSGKTAYAAASDVSGDSTGMVLPIAVGTGKVGTPIDVGRSPTLLAMTQDGKTLYVDNQSSNTVSPVTTATGTAGPPIRVEQQPVGIAIVPAEPGQDGSGAGAR